MKIAIASDDEKIISYHFGRAEGFVVFEIENGTIVHREYRKNIGKHSGKCHSCDHDIMIDNLKDCDVVISHGMGHRIYTDLSNNSIRAVITEEYEVEKALEIFLTKGLKNRLDKLH